MCNQSFAKVLGLSVGNILNKADAEIASWPPEDMQRFHDEDMEVLETGATLVREYFEANLSTQRWVEYIKAPLMNEKGEVVGILGTVRDITERKKNEQALKENEEALRKAHDELEQRVEERTAELHNALKTLLTEIARREVIEQALRERETQIKASLAEKEVLLREIHHRVKNNLQVISSLLYLQSLNLADEQALRSLQDSQNRVKSMALVHESLYQSQDLAQIDFARYVTSLIRHLSSSYNLSPQGINFVTRIEDISLNINKAIPCGLLLNELVSNALKHAFPDNRPGEVRIEMDRDGRNNLTLLVGDNGVGLPPEFRIRDSQSLGLQLIEALVEQIGGDMEIHSEKGATFKITFSETEIEYGK